MSGVLGIGSYGQNDIYKEKKTNWDSVDSRKRILLFIQTKR